MKIVRQTEHELVVQDSGLALSAIFLAAALPLLYEGLQPGKHWDLAGAAFFLLAAGICLRKTTFVFDSVRRMANWTRLRFFAVTTGEIPFRDITDIGIQAISGEQGNQSYRLTVITAAGPMPMAGMYGNGQKKYDSIRDAILRFIQIDGQPVTTVAAAGQADEASIRSLLLQGRKIDAIKLLRSQEQIDLARATQRVREIEKGITAKG
jgi:hypothetical protein